MKTYIARQPLFDMKDMVVGYELLFRGGETKNAHVQDGYQATLKVIKDLLINFGIHELSGHSRVFIKFNTQLILDGLPDFFKKESLVLELSDIDMSNEQLVESLAAYKSKGFLLAMDQYTGTRDNPDLLKIVDIVKLDFFRYTTEELKTMADELAPFGKILLAEKVEDMAMFEAAKTLGCTIFQGYYFQKPVLMESSEVATLPTVYAELIGEINKDEIDFDCLADIIQRDSNITVGLLKLMNSAAYYSNSKVTSIKGALVKLGARESKKVIFINMLKSMSTETSSNELMTMSLRRAKQAEGLADSFKLSKRKEELFIVGLLSMINIILRRPMKSVLVNVPLQEDVIQALLGARNELSDVMDVIMLHEMEAYDDLGKQLDKWRISSNTFNHIYASALSWSDKVLGEV